MNSTLFLTIVEQDIRFRLKEFPHKKNENSELPILFIFSTILTKKWEKKSPYGAAIIIREKRYKWIWFTNILFNNNLYSYIWKIQYIFIYLFTQRNTKQNKTKMIKLMILAELRMYRAITHTEWNLLNFFIQYFVCMANNVVYSFLRRFHKLLSLSQIIYSKSKKEQNGIQQTEYKKKH